MSHSFKIRVLTSCSTLFDFKGGGTVHIILVLALAVHQPAIMVTSIRILRSHVAEYTKADHNNRAHSDKCNPEPPAPAASPVVVVISLWRVVRFVIWVRDCTGGGWVDGDRLRVRATSDRLRLLAFDLVQDPSGVLLLSRNGVHTTIASGEDGPTNRASVCLPIDFVNGRIVGVSSASLVDRSEARGVPSHSAFVGCSPCVERVRRFSEVIKAQQAALGGGLVLLHGAVRHQIVVTIKC